MGAEFLRLGDHNPLENLPVIDTCTEQTASLCQLAGGRGGKFKLPTLGELHVHLSMIILRRLTMPLLMWRQLRVVFLRAFSAGCNAA